MADVKKRIKDAGKTLTLAQFLESYVLADSAAYGTGNFLGSHFVLGETEYGGTIVTNFNAISHTGFYTGLSTATGAPNTSYNWFVRHENSNAGTASAYQTAVAFASTLIVYERVKSGSAWQPWVLRPSSSDFGKILISGTDTVSDYLCNKMESTTLTLTFSVDAETGKQKLNVNVVNTASGFPINYEPFFPIAAYKSISANMYSGIASTALTRGFSFAAPRSMTVGNIGIYMKGEPSPSGLMQIELAIKDVTNNVVKKTAATVINTTNFINLASGGIYSLPLTEAFTAVGTYPYILYLMLKSSDGTTALSNFSNLQFMEVCDFPSNSIQIESGIYSQYSSQNFEGYGDTGYSNTACRPYMFISE